MELAPILTTLPHLAALYFPVDPPYSSIIVLSTTLSILWHAAQEPDGFLYYADYGAAGLWFLLDLHYAIPLDCVTPVLLLNGLVAFLNLGMPHSLWHLLSVAKALLVAFWLSPYKEMNSRSAMDALSERGFASNVENRNVRWEPSMDAERQYSMP
jgi:hypothetical protein